MNFLDLKQKKIPFLSGGHLELAAILKILKSDGTSTYDAS